MGGLWSFRELKFRENNEEKKAINARTAPFVDCLKFNFKGSNREHSFFWLRRNDQEYWARVHSRRSYFEFSRNFTLVKFQKTPFPHEKTKCFLLGLLKLNFAKVNKWCLRAVRAFVALFLFCFLIFSKFNFEKISKGPHLVIRRPSAFDTTFLSMSL